MSEAWTTAEYEAVARLVRSRTGLVFAPGMQPGVEIRIRREMEARSIGKVSDYLSLLTSDSDALEALVESVTIGETYFFREPAQLDYIRSEIIPTFLARSPGRFLRAWSAGCASGEEAYTLAIIFREAGLSEKSTVIGTDISHERLAHARKATYSRWSLRGVPETTVRQYFQPRGKRYLLIPEIRSAVTFRQLNLSSRGYPSHSLGIWGMDLILCRNVLIYMSPESVAAIADRLMASLSEEGWLVLGASDPPLADLVPCEVVTTGAGVAYRRRGSRASPAWVPDGADEYLRKGADEPASPPHSRSQPEIQRPLPEPKAPATPEEDGASADRQLEAVQASFAARDYTRAAEQSRQALERDPNNIELWLLRVRALAKQGRFEDAGRVCSAALETHRTSAELMCLHAMLLSAAGHHREAATAARRALYLEREMIMAYLVLGNSLLRLKEPLQARRALHAAERLLVVLPPHAVVPASDGEPAARLLELLRRQLKLATPR